uniref:TC1A n=1 Tax=Poeciliopsis prolifica TaxID=188132 RepID=A0A0S7F5D5_9TELE
MGISKQLSNDLVSLCIVQQFSALCTEKLYGRVMRWKPFLQARHKRSRLRSAKAHLDKPASFWNKVLWTDETKIELFGHKKGVMHGGKKTQCSKKNTCYPL